MVADDQEKSVIVFDADQDLVLGSVVLPVAGFAAVGDCAIDPSRRLGFVTDFAHQVWVIDLELSPPALAAGINPILVSNPGEDLALSPDRRFLAVCDGWSGAPLSIVDVETRTEVGTVSTGADCNSVDFCDADTLVGTSREFGTIVGFSLANDGTPSLSGTPIPFSTPYNIRCAPRKLAGVAISGSPARLQSFRVNGLIDVATRNLEGFGLSLCYSNDGQRLFVRTRGAVQAWSFNPVTGSLGGLPLYVFPADSVTTFFGMERIALHPDGSRLYVPVNNGIHLHDPQGGALLGTIPTGGISPGGIAVARGL